MEVEESVKNSIDMTVHFLQELIRMDTQQKEHIENCPFGKTLKEALDETLRYCKDLGFRVKNIDNYIGFAEIGEGEELIGIPVHLDIVPPGKGWSMNPFAGEIIDEIIYGRGAIDNKCSVSMLIHVVNNIKNSLPYINKRIRLIFGTNEETGMECIKYYLGKKEEMPTMGFTPDAMYPVVNGEKGRLHIKISKKLNVDKNKSLVIINGGIKENVVPSECEAQIVNIDINKEVEFIKNLKENNKNLEFCIDNKRIILSTKGIAVHGSTPEKGENAINRMLNFLVQENMPMENMQEICRIYKYLGSDCDGTSLGINRKEEIFKGTTVNLGVLKVNNREILIELDIRYGLKIDEKEIVNALKKQFNGDWDVNVVASKKLHYVDEENKVVKKLLESYEEVVKEKGYCIAMGGGTYASFFDNMVAFGPKFIDYKTGGHGVDERIPVEHLKINMEIYTRALLKLLKEL